MLEEEAYIQQNLKIIREYLLRAFPGFEIDDAAEPGICHKFTLTDPTTFDQFKLKVGWARLSDAFDEPDMMGRVLVYSDVAGKLRDAKYYSW